MASTKVKAMVVAGVVVLAAVGSFVAIRHHVFRKRAASPEAVFRQFENTPGFKTTQEAVRFLHDLRIGGRLPGAGSNDQMMVRLSVHLTNADNYPITRELEARKGNGAGPFPYHYLVIKSSADSGWELRRAWHVGPDGVVEEFSVP